MAAAAAAASASGSSRASIFGGPAKKPRAKAPPALDPSWYFLPELPSTIEGGARAPHERWVTLHCKCAGMPMDTVLRLAPLATVGFLKETLAAHHGGSVQRIELFREMVRDRIDERSVIASGALTLRDAWALDQVAHAPRHLPHVAHAAGLYSSMSAAAHSAMNMNQSSVFGGGGGASIRVSSPSASYLAMPSASPRRSTGVAASVAAGDSPTAGRGQSVALNTSHAGSPAGGGGGRTVSSPLTLDLGGAGGGTVTLGRGALAMSTRFFEHSTAGSAMMNASASHLRSATQQHQHAAGIGAASMMGPAGNYFITNNAAPRQSPTRSPERRHDGSDLHVEDDHVIVYYTFGAHQFTCPLLFAHA